MRGKVHARGGWPFGLSKAVTVECGAYMRPIVAVDRVTCRRCLSTLAARARRLRRERTKLARFVIGLRTARRLFLEQG